MHQGNSSVLIVFRTLAVISPQWEYMCVSTVYLLVPMRVHMCKPLYDHESRYSTHV